MRKEIVQSDAAPAAIGPYSQGTKAAGLVFISGQIPLDPNSGEIVKGDIKKQAERVMKNLEALLDAASSSWGDVIKTTIIYPTLMILRQSMRFMDVILETNPLPEPLLR